LIADLDVLLGEPTRAQVAETGALSKVARCTPGGAVNLRATRRRGVTIGVICRTICRTSR